MPHFSFDFRPLALTLVAGAALLVVPGRASSQVSGDLRGPFIGVGVGMENMRDQNLEQQRIGAMLHARVGWGLGHGVAPMLELGFHGLGDEEPQHGDVIVINDMGGTQVVRRPRMLSTVSALASVQVGLPGALYVRPGVGLGWHAFPVYDLFSGDTPTAETSHEAGIAAGLALGRTLNVAGRFPVAVEGVAVWTGGEDSTGSRWAAGVQIVPMIRF